MNAPRASLVVLLALAPALASAADPHVDPVASVVLHLALILVVAKLGGEVPTRAGRPAVLGELLAGVVLGNVGLLGPGGLEAMKTDPALDMLSRLGVLLLLFEVGLESTVRQMLRVGPSSLLVAVLGVAAPFALGWGVGLLLVPGAGSYVHAFLGAALSATSVGITARVLQDLGRSQTPEARIILGAAVIDDVLSPRVFRLGAQLLTRGVLLTMGLAFCFFLSWLAGAIGLAPIVGAFAAGLILEDVHYQGFVDRGEHGLEELVKPIGAFLVPVFFVLMGMRTDLRSFGDPSVLGLAAALTLAAILGKQLCAAGVLGRGLDRLTVGIGMVPRGEVGLIFANVGLALQLDGRPLLTPAMYAAVVIVVIVTTLVTPPALRWSLGRRPAGDV